MSEEDDEQDILMQTAISHDNDSVIDLDESMASLFNVIQNKLNKVINLPNDDAESDFLNQSYFKLDLTFDEEEIGAKNLNKRLKIKVTTDTLNMLADLHEEDEVPTKSNSMIEESFSSPQIKEMSNTQALHNNISKELQLAFA